MKNYKGYLIPDDLYYLILSYCGKTNWEWFKMNNLTIPQDFGFKTAEQLSKSELLDLIDNAVKYNVNQII